MYPKLRLIFLLSCCWLALLQARAQKYENTLAVCERYYEDGDYAKALDKCTRLINTLKRGSYGHAVGMLQMYQAKYYEATGDYLRFEQTVQECLNNRKVSGEKSKPYGLGLLEAAVLYAEHGYANRAEELLKQSLAVLGLAMGESGNFQPNPDAPVRAQALYVQVRVLLARGQFAALDKLWPALQNARQERTAEQETYYNLVTHQNAERKLSPVELKRRQREYAQVLTLKADAERQRGNYAAAQSALDQAEEWIRANTGTKDEAFFYNQHVRNLLRIDRGDPKPEIQKALEKTIFQAEKRLTTVHKLFLQIHETLIDNYIESKYIRRSKKQRWEFRQNTLRYYGPNRLPHGISQRLDAKTAYKFQRYAEAYAVLKGLFADQRKIPNTTPEHIRLCEQLYEVAIATDNYQQAQAYAQEAVETANRIYGRNSLAFHYAMMKLAMHYATYTNRYLDTEIFIRDHYTRYISPIISQEHKDRVRFLNNIADYYTIVGKYDSANAQLAQAALITKRRFGDTDVRYATQLAKQVRVQMELGNFAEADKNVASILEIFRAQYDRTLNLEYSQALETAASYYAAVGLFNQARSLLLRANRLFRRSNSSIANSTAVDELAALYIAMERFEDTEELLNQAIDIRKQRYGENTRFLITPYNQMARLQTVYGDYLKAEEFANKALAIANASFGENSIRAAESHAILADINSAAGDYEKAKTEINRTIALQRKALGQNNVQLANSLTQLALIMFYNKENMAQVEKNLAQALDIIAANLGKESPIYAAAQKNLALVYLENGKLDEAKILLAQADQIWVKTLGTEANINSAEIDQLQGDVALRQGSYTEAEQHYQTAARIFEKILTKEHPQYVKSLARLARLYYAKGDLLASQRNIDLVINHYRDYIANFFPVMSDREKARYWGNIRNDFDFFNNLAVRRLATDPRQLGQMYNYAMYTKALLINNTAKTRNALLASNDTMLVNNYRQWLDKKQALIKALALSDEQLREANLDPRKMQREIEDLDKQLSRQSDEFARSKTQQASRTWEEVRNALAPNEVAVEIVRYTYFDKTFTDSVVYAALVLFPGAQSAPKLVPIPNGNGLENQFLKFYRNSVRYNIPDRLSYGRYWKPLDEVIGKGKKIYLSGEGAYNQLNLEALLKDANTYVIDEQDIALITNTQDLLERKAQGGAASREFVFMGCPVFYKDLPPEEYLRLNARQIPQLPGTYAEVQQLKQLVSGSNQQVAEFVTTEATEERLKALKSPRVFHIATHGFFAPDLARDLNENQLNEQKTVNNPLLRSGLLLKYAGDLVASGNVYSYNREEGVLTAYEAMDLNLENTELVVLSACETALGDTRVGEGVYGLQRAFRVAGAQSLVMSLFQVDDLATKKLMELFYANWLKTGDKRGAFAQAKKDLRKEYPAPKFWGAFIMIGAN